MDVRKTALNPEGIRIITRHALGVLREDVQAIGGVELGAVPLVGSMVFADSLNRPGFIVRKAPKEHGTKSRIENCPRPGTRVCIVEDVTTTGGSLLEAIVAAREAGLDVVQAITVVDRQEGVADLLASWTHPGEFQFDALMTRSSLIPK